MNLDCQRGKRVHGGSLLTGACAGVPKKQGCPVPMVHHLVFAISTCNYSTALGGRLTQAVERFSYPCFVPAAVKEWNLCCLEAERRRSCGARG